MKSEKSSALENKFYTVAEGENFRERASLGRKNLKSEKNSALENNFSTVAEGENFREAKAIFFRRPEVDFGCVCAPVAITSRAVDGD